VACVDEKFRGETNACVLILHTNLFAHAGRLLLITTSHLQAAARRCCVHQSCTNVSRPLYTLGGIFVVRKSLVDTAEIIAR